MLIEFIAGQVEKIVGRGIVIGLGGIGWLIQVPDVLKFSIGETVNVFIYWLWNTEKGPSLFGFRTEAERAVFTMLLECPKIGPQISLQLLSQASAQKVLQILALADEHALSGFHGIGPKKAKMMVGELQDKAVKLLSSFGGPAEAGSPQANFALDEVCAALKSMGYSSVEISSAIAQLGNAGSQQGLDFASLMRQILAQLLKQKSL